MRSAIAALVCLAAAVSCGGGPQRINLLIGGEEFQIEVAHTTAEKSRGLMFRTELGSREGMLFVFEDDALRSFWMKDTTLPLSIAFLSAQGSILQISPLEPLSEKTVGSRLPARYALELNRGAFVDVEATEGDRIGFPAGFLRP